MCDLRILLMLGLGGCAPWVWNRQYVPCDEVDDLRVSSSEKRLDFDSSARDDGSCEVRATGLFGSRIDGFGNEIEFEEADGVQLLYDEDTLVLRELSLTWGDCDDGQGSLCGEGIGANVAADFIAFGGERGSRIRSADFGSRTSGRMVLLEDEAELACADCDGQLQLRRFDEVRVQVPGADGLDLCVGGGDRAEIDLSEVSGETRVLLSTAPAFTLVRGGPDLPIQLNIDAVVFDQTFDCNVTEPFRADIPTIVLCGWEDGDLIEPPPFSICD